MDNLDEYLKSAKETALEAGEFVRSRLSCRHDIQRKSKFDFVTEVDTESERIIRSALKEKYPDHLFFGEEEVSQSDVDEDKIIAALPKDRYVWVIDPVDGTTNFIRGIPQYAISIALMRNETILVGVVYDVSLHELFYAEQGKGAFCNDTPIHVSSQDNIENYIISTSFPAANLDFRKKVLQKLLQYGMDFTSLRIWNCASLAVIGVACGRTDAHIEPGIHLWDFAAGKIIVEEAGGYFSDIDGRPFHIYEKHVLASNGKNHDQLLAMIRQD